MKRLILVFTLLIITHVGYAQKFGFVDTDYILKHIPDYSNANKQLDALSKQWQKESDNHFQELDGFYKAYQKDQVLLSGDMKRKREQEIVGKEKEAKDFQKQKFGPDGELFRRRQALVKPIQDRIYKAIQDVAEDGLYAIIFDKAGDPTMLYSAPRYDKSSDVIVKLGFKPGVFAK